MRQAATHLQGHVTPGVDKPDSSTTFGPFPGATDSQSASERTSMIFGWENPLPNLFLSR